MGIGVGVGVGLGFAHLEGKAERREGRLEDGGVLKGDIGEIQGRYRGDTGPTGRRWRAAARWLGLGVGFGLGLGFGLRLGGGLGVGSGLPLALTCGTMPATRMVGSSGSMSERCRGEMQWRCSGDAGEIRGSMSERCSECSYQLSNFLTCSVRSEEG